MTELRRFKFATALVQVLEKIESKDKGKYDTFYWHSKAETIIDKVALMVMYLNQSILQLYQTYKKILGKVQTGLLIQS